MALKSQTKCFGHQGCAAYVNGEAADMGHSANVLSHRLTKPTAKVLYGSSWQTLVHVLSADTRQRPKGGEFMPAVDGPAPVTPSSRSFKLSPKNVPFSPLHKSKVIMLGDSGAGKTCLLKRMLEDRFPEGSQPTIGVDFLSKTIKKNGKPIRLQVWDSAGQERFNSLIPGYVRSAKLAIIVFDVAKDGALMGVDRWVDMVRLCKTEDISIVLVGNKTDMTIERTTAEAAARQKAQELCIPYVEVSAKTGDKTKDLLTIVIDLIEPVSPEAGGRLGHDDEAKVDSDSNKQASCYRVLEEKVFDKCCKIC